MLRYWKHQWKCWVGNYSNKVSWHKIPTVVQVSMWQGARLPLPLWLSSQQFLAWQCPAKILPRSEYNITGIEAKTTFPSAILDVYTPIIAAQTCTKLSGYTSHWWLMVALPPVFVSYGWHNKVPPWWYNRNLFPLSSGGWKPRIKVSAGPCSLWNTQRRILPCVFLAWGGGRQSLAFPAWQLPRSDLCPCHHLMFSCCICVQTSPFL